MVNVGLIWTLVKDAMAVVQKGLEYKSTRKSVESAVEELSPMVEKIEQAMKKMDLPTEHTQKLKEKLEVNRKSLGRHKIKWYNIFYAPQYKTKLDAGLTSMERIISVQTQIVMLQHLTDILFILSSQGHHHSIVSQENSSQETQIFKEHPKFTVGLDGKSMKKLKHTLLKLDGDQKVLNLHGLPGSGKTTMARNLCLDPQVKAKFKSNVIIETLGSQHDKEVVKKLQDKLDSYGEDPVLLVLDDVWPDSEDMVERLRLRSPDSRILVTSRAQIRTVKTRLPMTLLCREDAEKLLRHLVESSDINFDEPAKREILLQIVDKCEGLPLAIEFIGAKLKGKDIESFQKVQKVWSKGVSILKSNTQLLDHLQTTLNLLVDESIMDCFKDLGLFPEDHKVPVTALIDMWIELYELNEPSSVDGQKSSLDAIIFIKELVAKNLAAGIIVRRMVGLDVDNYYNNHFLMQHDLYRELAIHMSQQEPLEERKRLIIDMFGNQNNPPQWWPQQQPSVAAPAILSISTDQKVTPEWCTIQAASTEVLVLNLTNTEYTLPEFIHEMENLKVLIITNFGTCKTDLRNLQLLDSLLSLKRIRLQQVSIPSLCDLKNLHKLSLYMCDVKNAFENSSINFSEAMPKLEELSIEYCKDLEKLPTGLFNIVTMKNLIISSCHKFNGLPKEIENLENLEQLRINYCADFEKMHDSITKLKNLSLLDISFCVSLKKLPANIGEMENLTKLYMKGCPIRELPDSIINLKNLESVICDEYAFPSWEVIMHGLSRLNINVADMNENLNWLNLAPNAS